MKKIFFILTLILSSYLAQSRVLFDNAEELVADSTVVAPADTVKKNWIIKNRLILTGEQAYYNNWVKDGFNSIAISGYYLGKYNYVTEKHKWENTVELGYGILNQDINGNGKFDDYNHLQKSDDRFILTSAYNRKVFGNWYFNGTVDLRSQFTETYKGDTALTANFFAPAYLLVSLGLNYEKNGFTALLAPFGDRSTFVMDSRLEGTYGVEVGKKSMSEFGAYAKLTYTKDIFTNVNLATKLELFYDYNKRLFHETGVNWELFINMKVNKYLSAFFNTQLIYDVNASKQAQFKERLGLMISFDF